MRSLLATIALMIGCIVGGYAWSSLRAVSAKDDMQATMEAEFTKQFAEFAAHQRQLTADAANAGATDAEWQRDPRAQWRSGLGRIAGAPAALPDHHATR